MRSLRVWCICVAAALFACKGKSDPPSATKPPTAQPAKPTGYHATIRWTSFGIPHIEAKDLRGLAFGQAYAVASQNVCVIADQIVKVRSERAKYFGAGDQDAHLTSDFGWLALDVMETATKELPRASQELKDLAAGYTAGYNKYVAETAPAALPPDCANAPWVKAITETDLVAYWLSVGMIGSSGYFVDDIARAQPPSNAPKGAAAPAPIKTGQALPAGRARPRKPDINRWALPGGLASNGWAIGGDRAANKRGMLVGNPHFPWEGELRFSEVHLTIPGALDVYGAQLLGLPLVAFGFTAHHAWTATFSSSSRFVLYRLALDPKDPTRYRYNDEAHPLTSREYTIDVRGKDGNLAKQSRTLYRSQHGPIIANDRLAWDKQHAFALRDVTRSRSTFEQYLAMIRAKSLDEFRAAFAAHQTTPFLNTIYADVDGNAWYIDGSAVPDLPPGGITAWRLGLATIPALKAAWDSGVVVLDGSLPMFDLATTNKVRPGAIPTERAPQLHSRDYVMNANDSYWLTHPTLIAGEFSPFYGEAGRAPSLRTRMNHALITEVAKPTHDDLKRQILANRAASVELLREPVIERCKKQPSLAKACAILETWDGTFGVAAKGAALWREFLAALEPIPWAEPFDPKRPLVTPLGLAPAKGADPIVAAIKTALANLAKAGVAPDAALGDVQFSEKGGKRYGAPGSNWREGSTNPSLWQPRNDTLLPAMKRSEPINAKTALGKGGYPVNYGSSFILVVSYEDKGPRAEAILTYSQSTDPRSPHFADQTARYATADAWRPVLFTADAIKADPALRVQEVSAP
ncbi:MAG TPA: penicillin acylase family protein [Kofleriaceae bacterium]